MLPYRDSRLTKIVLAIFFIIIVGYAYYEARGIIYGPRINVSSGVQEVHDSFIVVSGNASRIAKLSMNGKEIPVTESGDFEEPYLLAPGLNRIVLDAEDRYGRTTHKTLQIVYVPSEEHPPSPIATSSPSGTTASSTVQ
ncbi:hypothetical protein HY970_03475 [Candidatus Kaiserbacteria bacterium]|nr:hypothetical protein [Candidatus Kaiserbacteria bacterium]